MDNWIACDDMNILILGGSGFIGKNMKEAFEKKYNVVAPTHCELDVLDEKAVYRYLSKEKYDVLINALDVKSNDNKYFETRMRMHYVLKKYSDMYGKMVYFGSGAEYGRQEKIENVCEEEVDRIIPSDSYGFCMQQMNWDARKSNNIYNLRLFGIYGKYELWQQRFISNCICKALKGKPIHMRQDRKMSYLYISDLVKMTDWVMNNTPLYHDYNATNKKKFVLSDIAMMINKKIFNGYDVLFDSEEMGSEYTACNDRIAKEYDMNTETDLEYAIDEMIEYYKSKIYKINF